MDVTVRGQTESVEQMYQSKRVSTDFVEVVVVSTCTPKRGNGQKMYLGEGNKVNLLLRMCENMRERELRVRERMYR